MNNSRDTDAENAQIPHEQDRIQRLSDAIRLRITHGSDEAQKEMGTPKGLMDVCESVGLPHNPEQIATFFRQNRVDWPWTSATKQSYEEYTASMNARAIELLMLYKEYMQPNEGFKKRKVSA